MSLSRFSVSLESDLLEALDNFIETNNFPNRSQAIRQLIERNVVEEKWQCNNLVAGAVILVYDCHKRDITTKLSDIQHAYREEILSVQRFQISQDTNFEIVAVRGKSYRLTDLSDKLITLKGVHHGKLVMTRSAAHRRR
jgi:CopG family nickel-responsive transcriptional regulator